MVDPAPAGNPRAYDLNGVTLGVTAASSEVAAFLDPILAPLQCERPPRQDWLVTLAPIPSIMMPEHQRCIFSGPLPEGQKAVMLDLAGERRLIVPGHLSMQFRRLERCTAIDYVPGNEATLSGTAAFWLIGDVLAASQRHLLHGAMLVDPTSERAIALFAPSGTGKTTTALALARAGFALAGDDALVLDAGEDRFGLWAIPRKTKIHRRTVALLPWLAPLLPDHDWRENEQALPLPALAPVIALAGHRRRRVDLLVTLSAPNDTGHRLDRIERPEALISIVHDNLRIAPGGVDADDRATLAALSRLVTTTPVARLSVGPDPGSLSRTLFADYLRSSPRRAKPGRGP